MSQHLRAHFRAEKGKAQDKDRADEDVRERYGLGEGIKLLDDGLDEQEAKREWEKASLAGSSSSSPSLVGKSKSNAKRGQSDLSTTLRRNTVERYNPFGMTHQGRRGAVNDGPLAKVGRGKTLVLAQAASRTGKGLKVGKVSASVESEGTSGRSGLTSDQPNLVPSITPPSVRTTGLGGLAGYSSDDDD
jgi:hypothetical protein